MHQDLVGRCKEKRLLENTRRRLEENIKTDLNEI